MNPTSTRTGRTHPGSTRRAVGALCHVAGLLLGALLLGTTLSTPLPLAAQTHFPSDEDLELMLRYLVEDGATPGIVLGVLEADGSTRHVSYGTGGPGAPPLTPRSVFELGSITKTFTATLLALAVRRGELALDDPVAKHLPDSVRVPSLNGREITLLDLATHRSGLPGLPVTYIPGDLGDPYADYTLDALYDFLAGYELPREPGADAEYSNLGFGLLGHALARAAGTSYAQLAEERIFGPLGMDMTRFAPDTGMAEWMAVPHVGAEAVRPWTGTEAIRGAGGLRSSMVDMLKYLDANVGPPETELERAMRDAHRVRARFLQDSEIGLGWRTVRRNGRAIVEHGGSTAGSSARIAFDPEREVGFVRLTNTGNFPDEIGLYLLSTGPPLDLPEASVPREQLERYVGAYRFAPGTDLYIRLEDDGYLTSQLGPTVRFRLYPDSDTSFFQRRLKIRLAVTGGTTDGADTLILNPGSRQRVMPKVSDETPDSRLPAPEILDLPLTAEDIDRYEGTYTVRGDNLTLEVRIYGDAGDLVARLVGGAATRLRYQGSHEFRLDADPASRAVFTVEDGRAAELMLRLHGTELVGRRVTP